MSRRSSYLEIDRIRVFLDCHESAEVTHKELEALRDLERAFIRQQKYVCHLVTSGRLDKLEQLQENLADQLASMEEEWNEAINSDEWAQSDAVGEKMIQDSRSWGGKSRFKIEHE